MIRREYESASVGAGMSGITLVLRGSNESVVGTYEMRTPDQARALISAVQDWLDSGRIQWDAASA